MNVTVMEPPSTGEHEVGACVTHKDQPMPSLVMKKIVASNGTEMYLAKSYAYEDKEELRLVLGDSLRAVEPGSVIRRGCKLFETLACPGLKALKRLAAALLIILPPLAYTTAVSAVSIQPSDSESFDQLARVKMKNNAAINLMYWRRA